MKSRFQKLIAAGYSALLLFDLFITGIVCFQAFFAASSSRRTSVVPAIFFSPGILVLGTIVLLLLLLRLMRGFRHSAILERKGDCFAAALLLASFAVMCIFAVKMRIVPEYDLLDIQRAADLMVKNDPSFFHRSGTFVNEEYFLTVQHQIPAMLLLAQVYRLGLVFGFDHLLSGGLFNALSMTCAGWAVYAILRKQGKRTALLGLLLFVTCPLLYVYVPYFYTDTLCMPWMMWGAYLLIQGMEKEEHYTVTGMFQTLAGILLLLIAMKIRATAGILLVALMIRYLFSPGKKKLALLTLIPAWVIVTLGMNGIYAYEGIHAEKDQTLPAVHYIMMGLNEESQGNFNSPDYEYTCSFDTAQEKNAADIRIILNRISDMGPGGLLALFGEKLNNVWATGDGMQDIFRPVTYSSLYKYTIGSGNVFFRYLLQLQRCLLLFLMFLAFGLELLHKQEQIDAWPIAFFGAVCFYLLWEVLIRYSMCFLPWMTLLAIRGLIGLEGFIEKNVVSQSHFEGTTRLKRTGALLLLLTTLCLQAAAMPSMTAEYQNIEDVVVCQPRYEGSDYLTDIKLAPVSQTFRASGKFNRIIFNSFIYQEMDNHLYQVEVLDGTEEPIYRNVIDYRDYQVDGRIVLELPDVVPQGTQTYELTIMTYDPQGETSMGMLASGYTDMLPGGEMYLDNQPLNRDLMMTVSNVEYRSYISSRLYLLIMLCILVIEGIAIYPLFKKE